jgi:uncharacterized protein (UPF0335 family)
LRGFHDVALDLACASLHPIDRVSQVRRRLRYPRRLAFAQKEEKMTVHVATAGIAGQELKQFVERVERLEEEKKAIAGDIREVYAEMKGRGFETNAVRQIVKMRKQDHAERKEMEAILDLYLQALDMS